MDLAVAAHLIKTCRRRFVELRSDANVDSSWNNVVGKAKAFANEFGIDCNISERRRIRKKMDGELCNDEPLTGENRLRVNVYYRILDEICGQLNERFSDEQTDLMSEIAQFSTLQLRKCQPITEDSIKTLCKTYSIDSSEIVSEYNEFMQMYKDLSKHLQTNSPIHHPASDDSDAEVGEDCECNEESSSKYHKENISLLEPLGILYSLSGYQHLLRLYWTLVTLPVSSCSAERALSRLRIIKNRLRSTMCDEWMKALMILACEKDIMQNISNDRIINSFAGLSDILKRQLSFS